MVSKLLFALLCSVASSSQTVPELSFETEPESDLNDREKIIFICEPKDAFGGAVAVEWFRNGIQLTSSSPNVLKMDTEDKKHILEMRELGRAKYNCKMHLKGTPLKLISQTALSIPISIDNYPGGSSARHIQVREGSTAVIPCGPLPQSVPKARSVLRFKKMEVVLDKRFKQMPSGDIFIYQARREDAGEYVCIAESPMTGERKEAPFKVYLIVSLKESDGELRTNATLVHSSPARMAAVVGSNVTLECIGNGYPKPTVVWRRVGSYLPAGYSQDDGTLTLQSVLPKHSGTYECSISNFVTVRSQTKLVVLEPPRLREPEKKVFEVRESMSVTLECEVIRGEPTPNISWYFNGEALTTRPEQWVYVSQNEVHIERASRDLHFGHYQCFADNSLGTSYVQYLVRVVSKEDQLPKSKPPPTPTEVDSPRKNRVKGNSLFPVPSKPHVKQEALDSVSLRWTMANSSIGVRFFKVQYVDEDEQWQTANQDLSPATRSFRLRGLKRKQYRFRVVAVYENLDHGVGKPSRWFTLSRSKRPTPPPAVKPSEAPREVPVVTVTPDSPSSLTATWKFAGAGPDGFLLKYRRTDSAGEWLTERLGNQMPWTFTISHLVAAQHYEVKMAALNGQHEGNYSTIEVARTKDSHPFNADVEGSEVDLRSPDHNAVRPQRSGFQKQHLVVIAAVSVTLGAACLSLLACVVHYFRRFASERPRKPNDRVRRQCEAAAYVNAGNSNFTPSISTVDLGSVGPSADSVASDASDSDESLSPDSLQSVSHEKIPRSEKEYALKILTELYTTNGHIVNINSNFKATTCA